MLALSERDEFVQGFSPLFAAALFSESVADFVYCTLDTSRTGDPIDNIAHASDRLLRCSRGLDGRGLAVAGVFVDVGHVSIPDQSQNSESSGLLHTWMLFELHLSQNLSPTVSYKVLLPPQQLVFRAETPFRILLLTAGGIRD